jgi:dTDP-4-dehydrorhamnose reductase
VQIEKNLILQTMKPHINLLLTYHPDAVIHCSAYTAVDKAEDDVDNCRKVNAEGPANIAKICKEIDAKMVYISTDYVFPGTGNKFYEVDDPKRDHKMSMVLPSMKAKKMCVKY